MLKVGPWIIGREKTTSDVAPIVEAVKKGVSEILGGVLYNTKGKLSDEKTISAKLLEANKGWVYRNNDVIAKEVGAMEFELYQVQLKAGEIEYVEIVEHPLLDILDRFNESTTKNDAMYITQSHKKLTGDAFWLVEGKDANITNIYALQPDCIELDIGDPTKPTGKLIKGYKYKQVIDGKTVETYYKPGEIIHFKAPNPGNMFRGYGAVEAAAETIDLDNLTSEVTRKFFDNGAIVDFVLTTENKLTDEQVKRLKAELRASHGGAANAFKAMILGGGLKPENISMTNRDMEFLAQLEWYRDKIMNIFGNTKASLGIIDDVNRASHESSIISWKRNSVKPEMEAIVNTLNEFLVPRFGKGLALGFCDPVPEDREAKMAEVTGAKDITTVNERRELLGYDPVGPEGDTIPEIEGAKMAKEQMEMDKNRPVAAPPKSLQNIDLERVLRRSGIYAEQKAYLDIKVKAKELATKIVKGRAKAVEPVITDEHAQFSSEKVWEYWEKQIKVVEQIEGRFKNLVVQFITRVEEKALKGLEAELAGKKKALINEDDEVVQAGIDFNPILIEQATIAGQQALRLIESSDPYIPFKVREAIDKNIAKFATSMLQTQRDELARIIAEGVEQGKSVPAIRQAIQDAFTGWKKVQAERVTRTEVIKVSNQAAIDAWEQSGVVEAKQWLAAMDDRVDRECEAMNGKIIGLNDSYIHKGEEFMGTVYDYETIKQPPLHTNCRCVLLPILIGEKAFQEDTTGELAELKEYVAQLEKIAGVSDEQ